MSAFNAQRIDLHHHVLPPRFVDELARKGIEWTGGTGIPPASVAASLEAMDRYGIAAAVASIQPQIYWGDSEAAVQWARYGNEHLARVVQDNRDRFGGFASVPLPDTAAALREVEYAYDVLSLDGVSLQTSYGNQYPGDPEFDELFQELERRAAVVALHPNTTPPGADVPRLKLPFSMIEFVFDTTRCIANLLYSGTLARYPSIRFIFPHAGGTLPFVAGRVAMGEIKSQLRERVPEGALHYLRQLYFDTAVATTESALAALTTFAPPTQIVFGSDIPMAPAPLVAAGMAELDSSPTLDAAARAAIDRENALRLFPRFARVAVNS